MKIIYFICAIIILVICIIAFIYYKSTNSDIQIADKLYESGNEIAAIPYYLKSKDVDGLFNSVKIYRFGLDDYGTGKDINKALRVLNYIINTGTLSDAENARMILRDIQSEQKIDNVNKKNTSNTDSRLNSDKTNWFFPHLHSKGEIPKQFQMYQKLPLPDNTRLNDETEQALFNSLKVNYANNKKVDKLTVFENKTVKNDSQNVHDHVLVRSVKSELDKLKGGSTSDGNNINSLYKELNPKQAHTLHKMLAGTTPVSSFEMSEYDILNTVWNRINHPDNIKNREELIKALKFQLEDGYDMCTMGRVVRVLQTLEGIDDTVAIKPQWAINNEMNNTASRIFTKMVNTDKYKSIPQINDENNPLIIEFKNEYEGELLKEFNIYGNILSTEYIKSKIDEYLLVVS
jgi:hypothetical protein